MSTGKRERQKANRAAKMAAQRAAARHRRNRNILLVVGGVVVLGFVVWLVVFLGGEESPPATTAAAGDTASTTAAEDVDADSAYAGYLAQPTACGGEAPEGFAPLSFAVPEQLGLSGTATATIETSCGPIEIALDADTYRETVNSFAFLAREGYFDGSACHRVSSGFMIQCGDPTATGSGGPGYIVPDEFPPEGFVYEQGVVAMANRGADSTGSQFFIVTGDASHLPPAYSILGEVVDGWDTLEALEAVPVETNDEGEVSDPQQSIYIESVTVEE